MRTLTADTRIRLNQIKDLPLFCIFYIREPLVKDIRELNSFSPDGTKQKHEEGWVYVPKEKQPTAEKDVEGKPFEKASDGSLFFGEITEAMAKEMGTNVAAPIKLSSGNYEYGKEHIEQNHWDELMAYYDNVNDFVEDISKNFTQIQIGKREETNGIVRQTYILSRQRGPGILYIELYRKDDEPYYSVNSGGYYTVSPKKKTNNKLEEKKKGEVVWRRPAPSYKNNK